MITKTQWHQFCEDLDRCLYQYPEWKKKVFYKGEEIDFVRNDVIYCKLEHTGLGWYRVVFKHPESIPEHRRPKELYRNVEIRGEMNLEIMKKWLKK